MNTLIKVICWFSGIILGIIFEFILLYMTTFFVATYFFPSLNGSYALGKKIYMLESHGPKEGRIIIFGTSMKGKTCTGGSFLVPAFDNPCEFVIDAEFDDKTIITRTENYKTLERKFYIISKDYCEDTITINDIRANYIQEFADSSEFISCCERNGISLRF